MLQADVIKNIANKLCFTLCGITPTGRTETEIVHLKEWLDGGLGENTPYMGEHEHIRLDATELLDGAKSAVVCAMGYKSDIGSQMPQTAKIASYALLKDYHKTIRKRLKALLTELKREQPHLNGRICVDSAPIFEKAYAVKAGLGWIGRQSLLINPQYGSYLLLGVLLLDDVCDKYDSETTQNGCHNCHRCIDNCPNKALAPREGTHICALDSRLCISALTVESDNPSENNLEGWVFGCDMCQVCCPYNAKAPFATDADFLPTTAPPTPREWLEMSHEEFAERFSQTPIKRAGLERVQKSVKLNRF